MKKQFSWRVFVSFGLFIAVFMMLVSGVILYISPPGKIANWSDWQMLGLTKRGWLNQHTIFGFAFLTLSLFHLFFINWKAFFSYLKSKTTQGLKNPVELLLIVIVSAFFGLGTYFDIQPFSAVIKFGNNISNSWERKDKQPPVPHAELMSLADLSKQPGLGGDPEALITKLKSAGLKVASRNETIAEIAKTNGMTAERVYSFIAPAEEENHKLRGEGFGRKTLQQVADDRGISATSLQLALKQKGIEARTDDPLRNIAKNNNLEMSEFKKLLEKMISR